VFVYICMCMHMGVGIYIGAFFSVSVACTLDQVFWTLVHGQVCTLHRCVFTPTYTSANTLAAGCAHMCIFIMHAYVYGCVCASMILLDTFVCVYVHIQEGPKGFSVIYPSP